MFHKTRLFSSTIVAALLQINPSTADVQAALELQRWDTLNEMHTGRSEISAAIVRGKVFVAGGIGFMRTLDSCEAYDIATNMWEACASLPYPLHHIALASEGETLYASGGYRNLGFKHDGNAHLLRLDASGERWLVESALPKPLGEHAMFAHAGNICVIGGRTPEGDSKSLWCYGTSSGQWQQLASMPTPRHSFSIAMADDQLWVLGGRSEALGSAIDRTEIYDFSDNSWSTGPSLPEGRGGHASVIQNRRLHVIGGEAFDPNRIVNRHDIYDIDADVWTSAPVPDQPRHGMASLLVDGRIFLFGGGSRPGVWTLFSASSTVQRFATEHQ